MGRDQNKFAAVILLLIAIVFITETIAEGDKQCAARQIKGASVVCVCNATYCDTITRQLPASGQYVVYTTSKSGLRFNKTSGVLGAVNQYISETKHITVLILNPEVKYQTIEGFGGAVTDAAGINWKNLSTTLQNYLIDSYFSATGLEYNMIRTPIGGCDFSTRGYAYNDLPENDINLTNFTLAYEDYHYKIPMIKAALKVSTANIHVVATTWSPPTWMKTVPHYIGSGYLKDEYYQTYADYHKKFVQEYTNEGIPIWGITTTNEPTDCMTGISPLNCLGWTANKLGKWVSQYLGPTIRNSTFKDLKILAGDDQRLTLPYWINFMIKEHPDVLNYIDGMAVHYYTDAFTSSSFLSEVASSYPDKFILATEACEGTFPWESKKVDFGSWQRAKNYAQDIITDLTHSLVGWIEWNLCLNATGGPNWVNNFADAPIIVFPEKDAFIKQPMFYAIGHFSKFIPRGSQRIELKQKPDTFDGVAFLTPNNTIVVVLYNHGHSRKASIQIKEKQAEIFILKDSITTIEISYS